MNNGQNGRIRQWLRDWQSDGVSLLECGQQAAEIFEALLTTPAEIRERLEKLAEWLEEGAVTANSDADEREQREWAEAVRSLLSTTGERRHRKLPEGERMPFGCANPTTVDGEEQMCAECAPCLDYIAEYWYQRVLEIEAAAVPEGERLREALAVARQAIGTMLYRLPEYWSRERHIAKHDSGAEFARTDGGEAWLELESAYKEVVAALTTPAGTAPEPDWRDRMLRGLWKALRLHHFGEDPAPDDCPTCVTTGVPALDAEYARRATGTAEPWKAESLLVGAFDKLTRVQGYVDVHGATLLREAMSDLRRAFQAAAAGTAEGAGEAIRHEDGDPHESHQWGYKGVAGGGSFYGQSMCADCGVDIGDDEALTPCPASTLAPVDSRNEMTDRSAPSEPAPSREADVREAAEAEFERLSSTHTRLERLRRERAAVPEGERLRERIAEALYLYHCQHTVTEDGDHLRLLDVLSPLDTVAEGRAEIALLADHLAAALTTPAVPEGERLRERRVSKPERTEAEARELRRLMELAPSEQARFAEEMEARLLDAGRRDNGRELVGVGGGFLHDAAHTIAMLRAIARAGPAT